MEVISLPWPHPSTFPNAKRRLHWSKYQPHCNRARSFGKLLAGQYLRDNPSICFRKGETVRLRVTFIPPNRIRRDDDGMIGAFKHYRDGLADAFGIDDQIFKPQYVIAEPEAPGRVEVEILA